MYDMMFDDLLNRIKKDNPVRMTIRDKARETVFVASYCTEHYPSEEYLKIFFDDGTILEMMPKTEDLYFCDDERREIDRNLVTDHGECLRIDNKEYLLENGNDKQIVKTIYYGDVENGEGGCVFSDYGFADEVWSLAVLDNGEVSDVHVERIGLKDIKFDYFDAK